MSILFTRAWAMPSENTCSVPPIDGFVRKYLMRSKVSVDPFARNSRLATHRNDLNPETAAEHHLDAEVFLNLMNQQGVLADLVICDPPFSPRQVSECYKSVGKTVGMKETQTGLLYQRVRNAILPVCTEDAVVLSFGWNSAGMGTERGFEMVEVLLVAHGGPHHDTICIAERRLPNLQGRLL